MTISNIILPSSNSPSEILSYMHAAVYIACADDGIGRFDRSTVSQQSLMELFIFGLDNAQVICGGRDNPADVCRWRGVICTESGEVKMFSWVLYQGSGTGTLGFEFLPSSLKDLSMIFNALSGTIELSCLPENMNRLDLRSNQLTGRLGLQSLPRAMMLARLSQNKFSGEISLEKLPAGLVSLDLSDNLLSGAVCLTDLPSGLKDLILARNNFTGSIDLTRLTDSLKKIDLSWNEFSGTVDLARIPHKLRLDASMNKLSLTRRKDTSPWWVGPVPQFWGKPRTFSNPSSCFCHGADPIDGHRKVVGQDQYPALGEVRETAKLLPRGQSPWWRDEGRHLLILCCFNPRDEISPHDNAKSREHAHTCRKARAIFKLRYKKKKKKKKTSSVAQFECCLRIATN